MPDALERDQDIVELVARGNREAAFGGLVERYEQKVYRLCCGLLRDPVLAEDAAQDSLLRIWRSLAKYDGRAALSTWIYAVTRNRCLTHMERRRAAEALIERGAWEQIATGAASSGDATSAVGFSGVAPTAVSQATSPPSSVADIDASTSLRELVDGLPDRYRQALTLFYFEERSVAETAEMLGWPEGTVKTNLARGRTLLLERMGHLGLSDPLMWLEEAR